MKVISIMLLVMSLAVGVFAGEMAKINKAAPDFTLTDAKGESHSLSDFKGKWVVLEWINFDCPFVRKHYDSGNMQKLQKTYTDKEVVWLAICSSAEGKQGYFEGEELTERIEEEKLAATAYLLDESGKVGKAYQAKTTPHMYIINPEGVLVYAGAIDDTRSTDVDDVKTSKNFVSAVLDAGMNEKELPMQTSKPYGCSVKYK